MNCFICHGTSLHKFLDLGLQPPSDAFVRKEDLSKPEKKYPLELFFCDTCGLVQLGFVVDSKELFTEYVYTTGMNNSLRKNFKELVDALVSRFKLTREDLAVDIGSNDGTLLENYAPYGVRVLGVDPSSAAKVAEEKGIRTVRKFFNRETAGEIATTHGKARIITATNVFAHVPDLTSFMGGITTLLAPDGVFVSESGYLLDMIETGGFDAIYHEHLRYYSLRPLQRLFETHGMELFDVERIPSHSGSIRVYAARKGAHPIQQSVAALLEVEESAGLYRRETLERFAQAVKTHIGEMTELLVRIRREGKRIVGIGAPAKGNTLLNSCGITSETVEALLEKSEHKIGLYAPGSHIPVKSEELLFAEQPDYALVLSWNLSDELIPKLHTKGYRGKFIIPFPNIHSV